MDALSGFSFITLFKRSIMICVRDIPFLIAASLIFSNRYVGEKGLFWNLTHNIIERAFMEIVFEEYERVTKIKVWVNTEKTR